MANYFVEIIEMDNESELERTRARSISTIVHSIPPELFGTDFLEYCVEPFQAHNNSTLNAWEAYAKSFSSQAHVLMTDELNGNDRWHHPAQTDRTIAEIVLGILQAEMDVRKEAYAMLLPANSTDLVMMSAESESYIHYLVKQGWAQMNPGFKRNPWSVSQIGANIFKGQVLHQLQSETDLLINGIVSNRGRLVGGTALRSL